MGPSCPMPWWLSKVCSRQTQLDHAGIQLTGRLLEVAIKERLLIIGADVPDRDKRRPKVRRATIDNTAVTPSKTLLAGRASFKADAWADANKQLAAADA